MADVLHCLDELDSNIDVVTPTLPLDAILSLHAERVQILFCEYLWKNGRRAATFEFRLQQNKLTTCQKRILRFLDGCSLSA